MKYLLSESEYADLMSAALVEREQFKSELQKLCTDVADHKPVDWGWTEGDPPKPWRCILSVESEWYCDSCPVQDVCPNTEKQWSK